jgi:hypothetical protein
MGFCHAFLIYHRDVDELHGVPAARTERDGVEPLSRRPTWPTWVEIILASGFPTQITIGLALRAGGLSPMLPDGSLSAPFTFALTLIDTVILLSLIIWLIVRRGDSARQVFFGDRPLGRDAALGFISVPFVIALVVVLTVAIRALLPQLVNVPKNPLEAFLGTQTGLLTFLVVVIVGGGIREEL